MERAAQKFNLYDIHHSDDAVGDDECGGDTSGDDGAEVNEENVDATYQAAQNDNEIT